MRNKRTVMYELKGSVEFEGEEKNCKIVFEELTDHCDEEYIVQTESV